MATLTCRGVAELLMDYLADALAPAARADFEAHLSTCDECVAYLRGYEQAVQLGRAAFERVDDPADTCVPRQLVEAILAVRRRSS